MSTVTTSSYPANIARPVRLRTTYGVSIQPVILFIRRSPIDLLLNQQRMSSPPVIVSPQPWPRQPPHRLYRYRTIENNSSCPHVAVLLHQELEQTSRRWKSSERLWSSSSPTMSQLRLWSCSLRSSTGQRSRWIWFWIGILLEETRLSGGCWGWFGCWIVCFGELTSLPIPACSGCRSIWMRCDGSPLHTKYPIL